MTRFMIYFTLLTWHEAIKMLLTLLPDLWSVGALNFFFVVALLSEMRNARRETHIRPSLFPTKRVGLTNQRPGRQRRGQWERRRRVIVDEQTDARCSKKRGAGDATGGKKWARGNIKTLATRTLFIYHFFFPWKTNRAAVRINGLRVTYCYERFPKTGVTAQGSRRVHTINEFGSLKGLQFIICTELA